MLTILSLCFVCTMPRECIRDDHHQHIHAHSIVILYMHVQQCILPMFLFFRALLRRRKISFFNFFYSLFPIEMCECVRGVIAAHIRRWKCYHYTRSAYTCALIIDSGSFLHGNFRF